MTKQDIIYKLNDPILEQIDGQFWDKTRYNLKSQVNYKITEHIRTAIWGKINNTMIQVRYKIMKQVTRQS